METEKQRRWWFATHPEFSKPGRGSRERTQQRFAKSGWQNAATSPRLFYGPPTLPDPVTAIHGLLDYLQRNNPILMDDRDRTREKMKKALERTGEIARVAK